MSFPIVHLDYVDDAKCCSEQTGLKTVTGKRYLEGFIGEGTALFKNNQELSG